MDELVRKILIIENKANKMIESEKEKLADLEKDVSDILGAKKKEMEEKSQARIDKISESEAEEEKIRLQTLESEFSENTKKLADNIRQNKEKWVSDIFDKIIG